jgi:branched-chain amino acid transport system ATP-binding protein
MSLLEIKNLFVSYGAISAINDISFYVEPGEIVTLIGANGAGKTTTLRAISHLIHPKGGQILYNGKDLLKKDSADIVRMGIVHVPEGRQIFAPLTVRENLEIGAFTCANKRKIENAIEWVYQLFPRLKDRSEQSGGTLSGGEQQMLAIARGLMTGPQLLLLDEPSMGLAPIIVNEIFKTFQQINQQGVTIILVEQNANMALRLARRGYVLETGSIVLKDTAKGLSGNPVVQQAYLGKG